MEQKVISLRYMRSIWY